MSPEFYKSLYMILTVILVLVPYAVAYIVFRRPALKRIAEGGEPPAIWRNRMARHGHTVLAIRLSALVVVVCCAVFELLTVANGFKGWYGAAGVLFLVCAVAVYSDHSVAKAHLRTPLKLLGLSTVPEGVGLLLAWLHYFYIITIPVVMYLCLNSISLLAAVYVMIMSMPNNPSDTPQNTP